MRSALVLSVLLLAGPVAAQPSMEIVVNIAAGRLDVVKDGARLRSFPVSVGLPAYATPTRSAAIRRMVWNPTWTPPPDAAWARDEKPAGPGPNNPMGRVKMHLFEDYYIHGTPAANERRLGRPASHGCIRMSNQDVMELARLVLDAEGAPVSEATLQGLIRNPGRTREVALRGRVNVRIEYRLAELDDYRLTLHPDVYARARGGYVARAAEELRGQGVSPEAIGLPALQRSPATALVVVRQDLSRPVLTSPLTATEPVVVGMRAAGR